MPSIQLEIIHELLLYVHIDNSHIKQTTTKKHEEEKRNKSENITIDLKIKKKNIHN